MLYLAEISEINRRGIHIQGIVCEGLHVGGYFYYVAGAGGADGRCDENSGATVRAIGIGQFVKIMIDILNSAINEHFEAH